MFHSFAHQLHVRHQPNLTGPSNRNLLKLAASNEAPAGFTERAPTGTFGKAAQQRSELPDRRVEICTLLCRPWWVAFISGIEFRRRSIALRSFAQLAPHVIERFLLSLIHI